MRAEILIRKFKSARLLFLRKSHKSDELESFTVIETRDAQAPLIILKVGESETILSSDGEPFHTIWNTNAAFYRTLTV